MQQHELEKCIKDNTILLSNRCTSGKVELLRSLFFKSDEAMMKIKSNNLKQFLRQYVDDCSASANRVASEMRSVGEITNVSSVTTIDPEYVKQMAYVSYDYPSILHYVDGLMKGITGHSISSESDIDNFRNHTILEAFGTQDHNVPMLLDAVISERLGSLQLQTASPIGVSLFNNMKNNNTLFAPTDRNNIVGCIDKILDYIITTEFRDTIWNDNVDRKLAILAYGSIIDYIAYIVTLYSCRISIIHRFAQPFIDQWNNESNTMHESTDVEGDVLSSINIINAMEIHNMCKVENFDVTFKKLQEYMKAIGITKEIPHHIIDDKLDKKLNDNLIWNEVDGAHHDDLDRLKTIWNVIKSDYSYPLRDDSSSKELLDIIPTVDPEKKTINDYKSLAEDTYKAGIKIARSFERLVHNRTFRLDNTDIDVGNANGTSNGIISYADEMYKLIMQRIHETFMVIEKQVNTLSKPFTNKSFDDATSISIEVKKDPPSKDDMIAEAFRELSTHNATNYELYNEYLLTIPGFESSVYLSEAGASGMMAKIKALMKALGDLIVKTFMGADLKRVRVWVDKNEQKLLSMDYPDVVEMSYLPYKQTLTFPDGWDKFVTSLSSFDINKAKDVNTWVKGLYPNETIAGWFANSDPKPADMYKNHLLFYPTLTDVKAESPKPVEKPRGSDIKDKLMKQWVATVKGSEAAGKELANINTKLTQAMNTIESKLVQQDNKQDAAKKSEESKSDNVEVTNAPSAPQVEEVDINSIMQSINTVINNIWNPVLRHFYTAIKDQYNYAREVYNIVKSHQAAQDTSGTPEADNPLITGEVDT